MAGFPLLKDDFMTHSDLLKLVTMHDFPFRMNVSRKDALIVKKVPIQSQQLCLFVLFYSLFTVTCGNFWHPYVLSVPRHDVLRTCVFVVFFCGLLCKDGASHLQAFFL